MMFRNSDKNNYKFRLVLASLISSAFIFSSCSTGLMEGSEAPASDKTEPKAPPERVVVDGMRTSYADLVEKTSPAVVKITSLTKNGKVNRRSGSPFEDFFRQFPQPRQNQRPSQGFGSGVLVSEDGTILTNHHVIGNADKITVEMENDKRFDAKVIGSDPPSDLAVLKIEGEDFPYLKLGDSDKVLVGDIVLAIGNPLGIGQTVTSGIISAKGRQTGLGDGSFEDFLQTDAPINRGNSGGALVNLSGELIGINSQILSPTGGNIGIGFSIPSNMAKSIMDQLIETGKVRRGMLGITIQNLTPELAERLDLAGKKGVLVSDLAKGSAADKAGMKRGDVITAIDGETVEDGNALRNKVAGTQPGTEITLTVLRGGDEIEIKATLDARTPRKSEKPEPASEKDKEEDAEPSGKMGLSLQPLTPELARRMNIPDEVKGLIVTDVDPGGPAAEKGIRRGDVIMEVNRKLVATLDDVRSALKESGDKPVLFLISRGGQAVFITVTPAGN